MNPEATGEALTALHEIAQRAGRRIMDIYADDFEIQHKADRSPLTEADLRAHRSICRDLASHDPETPVMSEESNGVTWDQRRSWARYYLVDPLDGTREFVNRNGEFTVNIALIEHHLPILGVVHVPVTGITYAGAPGYGAWRQDRDQRLEISTRVPAARPPVVAGSRSHANPDLAARLDKLGPHRFVSMGSSLKFCLVAEGTADFYPRFGPTSEWDTAAAQAIVEAAGGQVVTLDGAPLRYNMSAEILNPHFLVFGDPGGGWLEIFGEGA
ncbi:MAG: 3'(2'),5'-bisphosphate nucleotidase CysQ [Xanthomonadales bacterium]|nr:3'(2'),5'-bisphosphate nucleotidase CysQ [Xanthomonadales bacterium]